MLGAVPMMMTLKLCVQLEKGSAYIGCSPPVVSLIALLLVTVFAGCCPIREGVGVPHVWHSDQRLAWLGHWYCVDCELGVVGEHLLLDTKPC